MRHVTRSAPVLAALLCSTVGLAPPAHARSLSARIKVDPDDLSATGYVYDTVFHGRYAAVLTAVGVVNCGYVGPQTVVADAGRHDGNPATPATDGTCANRYTGEVTYNLEWVGTLGTSGHLTRVCTVTFGNVSCTPEGTTADLPEPDAP